MTFRTIALVTILTGATSIPAYALEVGGSADAGAGVNAAAGDVGNVGANAGADVGAGVTSDTQGTSDAVDTATDAVADAATDAAASVQVGTRIVSADGQVIGEIAATRETDDGRTQAVIAVDEGAGLSAEQIAIDTEGLKNSADGAVEYGHSMADLRAGVDAQVGANADVSN